MKIIRISLMITIVVFLQMITGCSNDNGDISVTEITLNKTSTTIPTGRTEQLSAVIEPADATNKNVTWSSSDVSIASVSSEGLVTGVSEGVATITATTEDGNFSAECIVTILNNIFSSNLPIVFIDTYGKTILDDPKIDATMQIMHTEGRLWNSQDDLPVFSQRIGIEIRGSSSQMFPKKQYGFETWDELNEGVKVPILDFPSEKDWILSAPYSDKSLIRNNIVYTLSSLMGHYASRVKYTEAFINQDGGMGKTLDQMTYDELMPYYSGIYVIMEKIKRGSDRVNISKISDEDPSGGYILKIDNIDSDEDSFDTINGVRIIYVYPKADDITDNQKAWISNYMNGFEIALSSDNFTDPDTGYANYINTDSFIDYFLLNELTRNVDAFCISTYMYKDRLEKLCMGPVWDFDLSLGNCNYYNGWLAAGWSFRSVKAPDEEQVPFWWNRLFEDPAFVGRVVKRWHELRKGIFSINTLLLLIDENVAMIEEAQARNFMKWPILGIYVWPNPFPYPATYAGEIITMKNWLQKRVAWMDDALEELPN
jgi:spore coat protein CotH